mgnify:FL=1
MCEQRAMSKPKTAELIAAAGISKSYASEIANGRTPTRALAIHLFRKLGYRDAVLDGLSDEQIATLEQIEPWVPPSARKPTPTETARAA